MTIKNLNGNYEAFRFLVAVKHYEDTRNCELELKDYDNVRFYYSSDGGYDSMYEELANVEFEDTFEAEPCKDWHKLTPREIVEWKDSIEWRVA